MTHQQERKSPRWNAHDYRTCAVYFVTMCAKDKRCIFGAVHQDTVRLSALGLVVDDCWRTLEEHHPMARIHDLVVMPNHVHALIELKSETAELTDRSLSTVISNVKAACTRRWRVEIGRSDDIWHRSFHDTLIRTEKQYDVIQKYIQDNPIKWHLDRLNPGWRF